MAKVKRKSKFVVRKPSLTQEVVADHPDSQIRVSPSIKVTAIQAAIIITVIGFAVFFSGLMGPFQGDDSKQIVDAVPVHSITNIALFFQGGTFDAGQGLAPLSGAYYRPLMTTTFSLLYSAFGPNPFYFHLLQLLLCIGSTILLFLFFRFSFSPLLSLVLALIFLVHPVDSQVAFAIPAMQDGLFFFFGILSLYLLVKFQSFKVVLLAVISLLLSLLAKESAVFFVFVDLLYLFIFDTRKRLFIFCATMAAPFGLYLYLKISAVGLNNNLYLAPIDRLGLNERIMNVPAMLEFYISKFIFPWRLGTGYYWAYTSFSITHVLIPLAIDSVVIGAFTYVGTLVKKRSAKNYFFTYIFFASWTIVGLLAHMQLIPLDLTASETWFYFSMAGILGMLGVALTTLVQIRPKVLALIGTALVLLLGIRTAIRGIDWNDEYVLANNDIVASDSNYSAHSILAAKHIQQHQYSEAAKHARQSIDIYPTHNNYFNLGVALVGLRDYPGAYAAYENSLKYGINSTTFDNMAALSLVTDSTSSTQNLYAEGLKYFPRDYNLWMYLALRQDMNHDNAAAQASIQNAAKYGPVPSEIYTSIVKNEPFKLSLASLGATIEIN